MIGNASNSGFVVGVNAKDMFKGGWGFYCHTSGSGSAYTGETGIDYSSICDRVEYTEYGVVEKNITGGAFGVTNNLATLFKNKDIGFTLFLGLGLAKIESVSQTFEYYIWDGYPRLNDSNLVTWVSDSKIMPSFEVLLGYDFFKKGAFKLNVNGGYSMPHGLIWTIGIGVSTQMPKTSSLSRLYDLYLNI